jgi:formylglycine-generating enzyme required for sulfatase activity/tRNA A-37 threonylcarbamoyl transferase component Bud32
MSDKKPDDELLGQTIAGRYRIISRLGAGGMGVAYRAWDETAGLPVVIKIPKKAFLEDPKFAERFAREIRLLQGFEHPHIVPIVDVGEHDGLPFVVMRFLPGGSLANRRLRDEQGMVRPNPPGMLHLWLPAVADALDHVHANGVVHRDVKPANIFFDAYWNAFLGDFGIAKIVEESDSFDRENTLTATSMGIGTPDYMAPEQFTPKPVLDGRTDQYALAVTVYEMLAGTRPFTGSTAHIVVEVTTQPPPRLDRLVRGLPDTLVAAVHQGLAKQPGERFATCRDFASALLRDVTPLATETDLARLLCPDCGNLLKLPGSAAGRKGKCPRCQKEMKVADDLGALWLLDEARRQEETGTVVDVASDPGFAFGEEAGEGSLADFKPVSGTTRIERAARRSRKGLTAWINAHGLAVAAVLGLLAVIPWAILALGTGGSEVRDLKAKLRAATARERDLAGDVAELEAARDTLQQQLAEAASGRAGAVKQAESAEADKQALQARITDLEATLAAAKPASPPEPDAPTAGKQAEILARPPITNSIGMKLKLIPAGSFMMGSEDGEANEKPVHEVRITKPFYLGVTEVTNAQWEAVMGVETPSKWTEADRPVETVSWNDAVEFCKKLSGRPEERALGRVYRLPTEAEWEYACRAGTTTKWASGDDEGTLGEFAWLDTNSSGQTHNVGGKRPNAWGLYDMHGNVWEWCSDWYGTYAAGAVADPTGPAGGSYRVFRGGSWSHPARYCRSASRHWSVPSSRSSYLGFRLALSPSESRPPEAGK